MHKGAMHADDMGYIFKYPFSKLADTKDKEMILLSNGATIEDSPLYLKIGDQFTMKAGYEPKKMAVYKEIYDKYMK
ncbi:unnamed protein product [Euphydryas editha]|uniref:Uncharacterized protein n=1 Tax=Euphydryas editha TaxID=104508 RepID=A0AAU9TZS3_EUPED|nr:unnamed protein product [Euphydryas editha]